MRVLIAEPTREQMNTMGEFMLEIVGKLDEKKGESPAVVTHLIEQPTFELIEFIDELLDNGDGTEEHSFYEAVQNTFEKIWKFFIDPTQQALSELEQFATYFGDPNQLIYPLIGHYSYSGWDERPAKACLAALRCVGIK